MIFLILISAFTFYTPRPFCFFNTLPFAMLALKYRSISSCKVASTRFFHAARSCNLPHSTVPGAQSKVAYAFDIDGVLIRGNQTIPQAKPALEALNAHQIPWILLTNGGGKSEKDRVAELSQRLSVPISEEQFIQSHTPFRNLASKYHRVLVVGGDNDRCRQVAEQVYGFRDAVIPADVVKADPAVWPFHQFRGSQLDSIARDRDLYNPNSGAAKVDAILVFNDPRDMGTDVQVVLDLLLSQHGYFGTRRDLHAHCGHDQGRGLETPSIPIYFSNNDLLWANSYPIPRFGQGAFRIMVEALYKQMTGGAQLESTIIGKPFKLTYDYADSVLRKWKKDYYGGSDAPFEKVYMVGDNPASDIMGANNYGWESLLVRTGVFRDEDLPNIVAHPKHIFDNVGEAVNHGIAFNQAAQ